MDRVIGPRSTMQKDNSLAFTQVRAISNQLSAFDIKKQAYAIDDHMHGSVLFRG